MYRFYATAFLLVVLSSVASAQEPRAGSQGPDKSLAFEVEVYEFSTDLARDIERIAPDRSRLDRSITEGKVRPFASINMRTRAGESAVVRSGQRIPVETSRATQGPRQVQYENTGLNLTLTPSLSTDDRIVVGLSLEISATAKSASMEDAIYFTRSFNEKVRMKPNEKVVLLSVVQQGSLWMLAPAQQSSDAPFGNFVILLTCRVLD